MGGPPLTLFAPPPSRFAVRDFRTLAANRSDVHSAFEEDPTVYHFADGGPINPPIDALGCC
jgi:hypothetical protein